MSVTRTLVQTAARFIPDPSPDALIDSHAFVGQPLNRVDGRMKVTGGARFTAEHALEDLAYAAPVFSTIAKGKVTHLDTAAAKRSPGVISVITPKNMPRIKAPTLMDLSKPDKFAASNLPVLQDYSVHWNGQIVAVVVAETHEQAQEAAALVAVEYDQEDATLSFDAHKLAAQQPKDIMGEPAEIKIGDAQKNLAAAPVKVDPDLSFALLQPLRHRAARHHRLLGR